MGGGSLYLVINHIVNLALMDGTHLKNSDISAAKSIILTYEIRHIHILLCHLDIFCI